MPSNANPTSMIPTFKCFLTANAIALLAGALGGGDGGGACCIGSLIFGGGGGSGFIIVSMAFLTSLLLA